MNSLGMNRVKSLFSYANLNGSSSGHEDNSNARLSTNENSSIVTLEPAGAHNSGLDSKSWRRKRKIILGSVIFGIVAVTIIALTIRHKQNVQTIRNLSTKISAESRIEDEKRTTGNFPEIKLNQVVGGKFWAINSFNGTWINDEEFLYYHHHNGLFLVNVKNPLQGSKLMSSSHFDRLNIHKFQISADKKYLMLQTDAEMIFRHSTLAEYVILPLENGKISTSMIKLRPSGKGDGNEAFPVRYAKFSPTGNGIVYVGYDLNIYLRRSVISNDEQLTETGNRVNFFNGVADWVFEEEVFEDDQAIWWAPDGNSVVYGSFNDSRVETIILKDYGSYINVEPYPLREKISYPKAGTDNPVVGLWVANFYANDSISKKQIAPPRSLAENGAEVHFAWVKYLDANHFAVRWMNRVQNRTILTLCKTSGMEDCKVLFEQRVNDGYVDFLGKFTFNPNKNGDDESPDFVTRLSDPHSEHRYKQLVHISGKDRTYLTRIAGDVDRVLSWSKDGFIYFMASLDNQPRSKHMFRVPGPSNENKDNMMPYCITCDMKELDALHKRNCSYFDVEMSRDGGHYAMTCMGPDIPYVCLHETASGKLLSVYEDNSRLQGRMRAFNFPRTKYLEIPVPDSKLKAQVKMLLPPDFDPLKKYPMLVYVYGGPGSQYVTDKFDLTNYEVYLSGAKSFIYTTIDPMGSGGQGDAWRFATYRKFGTAEAQSTIDVTKYLQKNLDYVDEDRTAIWGWSYGGFLSLSVLTHDNSDGVFQCGASVAPVVDWVLYDTYYTERYMGMPQENQDGYNNSRVIWGLENLRKKPFYLLHGTRDDNVHYQNSMLLSAALEKNDILFRQNAYPDQDHSIGRYLVHLYHSLTDFFLNDCFSERKTRK